MENTGYNAHSFETAYHLTREAVAQDIDELGHVNNTVYLKWVQDIAVEHWSKLAPEQMQEEVFFIVLRHEIDYREPIVLGDSVEVCTWLGKASGPRFDRYVDIRRKGAKRFSARARTTWCMLNKETGRPQRVGLEIFNAFGVNPEELE